MAAKPAAPYLTALLLFAAAPAAAQTFDVPAGFVAAAEPDTSSAGEWRGLTTVRPEEGAFSGLSTVRLP